MRLEMGGGLKSKLKTVLVSYKGGQSVTVPMGTTVLAASRASKIAHASVCGGKGRCSTCRVRVLSDCHSLPPPDEAELALLRHLPDWSEDVRLGCRLRIHADIEVELLVPPNAGRQSPEMAGRLLPVTVMFVDIRGFSRMSARMHPFDVVFLLNRFFDVVGTAVTKAGGMVDKFMGDGVMALFGVDQDQRTGARQSLVAAKAISRALHELNQELTAELTEPLRIGIGLHCGSAIVGRFGWTHGAQGGVTAIGDIVNVASRLESATKAVGCQLVMSESVALALDDERLRYPAQEIELPNYTGLVSIRAVTDACDLPL